MKQIPYYLFFLLLPFCVFCQVNNTRSVDSLIAKTITSKSDTSKVNTFISISKYFASNNPEKAVFYGKKAAELAIKLHWQKGLGMASNAIGNGICNLGDFDEALKVYSIAYKIADSLKDKLSAANALNNIAIVYTYKGNFDDALKYNLSALQLRTSLGDEKSIASSFSNIGALYENQGNLTQALNYYNKALQSFKIINNLQGIAAGYHNIGSIYREQGNFSEALKLYFTALTIDEQLLDTANIAMDYSSIGILYNSHGDYREALHNYFSSIRLFSILQNKYNLAVGYLNVGGTYSDLDSLKNGLKYYKLSLEKGEEINDSIIIAKSLVNIGQIYFATQDFKSAHENYNKALQIYNTTVKDSIALAALYSNIASLYSIEKDYMQGETFALKGLELADRTGSLTIRKAAHQTLAAIYEKTGKFKEAFFHLSEYQKAKDSLFNEDNTKKIVQAQMKYDFDKKELLADAAYKKQMAVAAEKHRSAILLGSTIALALLSISFIGFYFYRRVQKNKFRLQMAEIRQEALLAQLDTHFISDTIVSINNYIVNNSNHTASKYLLAFGTLIRNTLQTSFKKSVSVKEETDFVNDYLNLAVLQYPQAQIVYSLAVTPEIDPDNTLMPPMVLQVLVENAVRHAFAHDKGGYIAINIKKAADSLHCSVEDNGQGRKAASAVTDTNRPSYGSLLAQKLLATWSDIFGKTTFSIIDLTDANNSPIGTKAEFFFPLIEK